MAYSAWEISVIKPEGGTYALFAASILKNLKY